MSTAPYRVLANKDQLERKGLWNDKWVVHTFPNGAVLPNRVAQQFETLNEADAVYKTLELNRLVAFKNWAS